VSHPEHLLWLLLLPILYLLARPVRPKRTETTPHLAQWRRALARIGRRPVRLRWLRLLLLVVAFLAGVLALTGPTLGGRAGPRELVVLLDTSASMAAGGAYAAARARLAALVDALPEHIAVRLALCGRDVAMRRGARGDLLADLPAPAGEGRIDLGALAAATEQESIAVWTLTDALGATRAPQRGALTVVGEPQDNFALTSLEALDHWPLARVQLRVAVANFAAAERALTLAVEGAEHPDVAVTVAPGATAVRTLELQRGSGGPVRVFLRGHGDALALDDSVAVRLPPPPSPDIAVLADAEAGPEIRAAAAALAAECGGRVIEGSAAERAGFLLVEGGRLPRGGPHPRSVTFGTRFGDGALGPGDLVEQPLVVDWDRGDAVTAGLDLSELVVDLALRPEHLLSGRTLLSAGHGPLAVRAGDPGAPSIQTAFRLSDSNFALLPAFPQFLRRAYVAAWSAGARAEPDPTNLASAAESDLRRRAGAATDRPLPAFAEPGRSLAGLLLAVALAALVARLYA
jgi:hypothetical protein